MHPNPTPRHRKVSRRLRRSARRVLRGARQKWVLASLAALAVLLIGLISQGFLHSPGGDADTQSLGAATKPVPSPNPGHRPGASHTNHRHHPAAAAGQGSYPSGIPRTVRDQLPDNPLNHLHGGYHRVTVKVVSTAPIPDVGYLVPTGLAKAYGTAHPNSRSWSLTQKALGKGYLAAIFIQSDQQGSRITCSVTVDGKQTNSETASSPYARAVCLG